MEIIRQAIRQVPDFPKKGILFYDITTLLTQPPAFRATLEAFERRYCGPRRPDAIVAMESRGFLFAAPLAAALAVPLVLVRKPKKLPGPTISQEYKLEYGSDRVEMHADALAPGQRVLILDDLLATGGTAKATAALCHQLGAEVMEYAFVVELTFLPGRKVLGEKKVFSLVTFDHE